MSRKNQNDDKHDDNSNESLTDDHIDSSNNDPALDDEHVDRETIETVEELEEILDDTVTDLDDVDDDIEKSTDQTADQGFDQQNVAPVSENTSSGSGMAGTAMGLSLLALAGTGYNLYNSNTSAPQDASSAAQESVDYSGDIESIQAQIQALTESQEKLNAMASTVQSDTGGEAEQVVEADQADETAETMAQAPAADESAGQDETSESVASEAEESSAESEATEVAMQQDQDSATDTDTAAIAQDDSSAQTDSQSGDSSAAADESEAAMSQDQDSATDSDTAAIAQNDSSAQPLETETETTAQADSQSDDSSAAVDESEAAMSQDQSEGSQTSVDVMAAIPSGDEIKQMAMEQVSVVLDDAKMRLGLSEVAQLLSIGEQRLVLAADVGGAQAAFGLAEQRLSAISDPMVDPVKESIASNLQALDSLEVVDKNALTQELNSLSTSIDTLAFKPLETLADQQEQADGGTEQATENTDQAAESETQTSDAELSLDGAGQWLKSIGSKVGNTLGDVGSGIAGDLKDMVRVQKTGPLSDVVLAPEQQYFIRENIKLQLGSAQRAVLQDNTGVFKQSLTQARTLVVDFFDTENEDVNSVSTRLTDLEQVDLELQVPDISTASALLSQLINQLPEIGSSETNSN